MRCLSVIQTQGKTQQGVNTQVRHVVSTVEVETPKIVKEAVRGKKVIREKINQFPEHIKNPQIQFSNKVDEMPVVVQRQNPLSRLFRRPWRFHSCGVLTRWLVSLLGKFQGSRSWRRQPKSHSCRPLRKLTQAPESSGITPVRQVSQTGHVEELVEVSRVFSQDTVQQRFGKQTIEIPTESESPIFVTVPVWEKFTRGVHETRTHGHVCTCRSYCRERDSPTSTRDRV